MFKNYFKIALRNIFRNKGYSFINIFGLTIGIVWCIFIFLYIYHEMSYDRHHPDHQRVYRLVEDIRTKTSSRVFAPITAAAGQVLKDDFPEVETVARILPLNSRLVEYSDAQKAFYENPVYSADAEIFDIFRIPFLKGNPARALERPRTVVINASVASKYFGDSDPLGKVLKFNKRDYEVTGVIANAPTNTHWKYQIITSLKTYEKSSFMKNWHATMAYTYLKLKPGTDTGVFESKIRRLADAHVGEKLKNWGTEYEFSLQPISDIHLYSNIGYELEPPGNPQMIGIFSTIGILVLLIACMNFINLATARSMKRAREVGIRKAVGGERGQLIRQFLGESFLVAFFSLTLAVWITALSVPLFNRFFETQLSLSHLTHLPSMGMLLLLLLITGLAAGLYPAFVLSGFQPTVVLKASREAKSTRSLLRRVLVLMQFAISIVLIIVSLGIYKQLNFMKNQYLGFDKEQKLVIPVRGTTPVDKNYKAIKDQFLKHTNISKAAASSAVPGEEMNNYSIKITGAVDDKFQSMYHLYVDADFIPNYGIKMLGGRAFDEKMSTDVDNACVINRTALKAFGFDRPEDILDKVLESGNGSDMIRVIGVTEDFHYRGLQYKVEPLVMPWRPDMFYSFTLTVNTGDLDETLDYVGKTWASFFPGKPFEYKFLDENFNRQYKAEERAGRLISVFTLFGQLIACLGLFGLAAFTTQQRTKEISIRKVLGAEVPGITFLVSREFLKWVTLANVLAWPVAYFALTRWMDNFAYRAHLGFGPFILAGFIALAIAMLTVMYQAVKAATSNPANALRFE